MDYPDKLATLSTQERTPRQTKAQHNICWTPPYANKLHK